MHAMQARKKGEEENVKLTLTYEFDVYENQNELQTQLDAQKNAAKLDNIKELFRKRRKYYEMTDDIQKFFNEFDEEFLALLNDD